LVSIYWRRHLPPPDRTDSIAQMTFSILFDRPTDRLRAECAAAPPFFVDLNLDQIVDAITSNWSDYNLNPFFCLPLLCIDTIRYRHEVFRDLEDDLLLTRVRSFAQRMRDVRTHLALANKLNYRYHQAAWFLHAAEIYCDAVERFAHDLSTVPVKSRGFLTFREYLTDYAESSQFALLLTQTKTLTDHLSDVAYCVLIHENSFTVRTSESEADYSAEIEMIFEKFKQGAVKDYKVQYSSLPEDMNHIEAKILEFVGKLNPSLFLHLIDHRASYSNFIDNTIAAFDREIHFYIAYLEHVEQLKRAGLPFCYPHVSTELKHVHNRDGFDLALARKLINAHNTIVCNDFCLKGKERLIVVSGPNQGGKTTFARTFGQLHYLASLGCPVPGREARLFLFDQLFTHFEREEKVGNLRGKLEDDLVRVHSILERATSRSVVILNEIFTSTTIQDETFLSKKLMERLAELDLLGVWVTFVDELASFNEQTVSMVSTIVTENPVLRTFKIVRRPADGLAYAMAIAEKYRLTYDRLKERIGL
jgi:DNA mismatch repair protein MutS